MTGAAAGSIGIRMTPSSRYLGLLAAFLTGACSGGGGGAVVASPPTIVSAAWVGTGAPQPGDFLELFFSDDVAAVGGRTVDASDLELSAGSLGAITAAPTQSSPRVLRLTLGSGVAFTPGTTTINLRATNDAIQSSLGKLAVPGTPRVISSGDGVRPTVQLLTVNEINAVLNGTGTAGGSMQTPRNGFTIDVSATDSNGTLDSTQTVVAASGIVGVTGGGRAAGADLSDALVATLGNPVSSYFVPSSVTFPEGPVTITVYVVDASGMVGGPATYLFQTRALADDVRPFENGQLWFLDFSRDLESYTVNLPGGDPPVKVVVGANGRTDFADLMLVIGLHSTTPISNVSGGKNSNEIVLEQFQWLMGAELRRLYPAVDISFTFTAPGSFPGGRASVDYSSFSFSQICIAGAEAPAGNTGVLGVALFDPNNRSQDNNCLSDYANSQRLGVFLHTLVNDEVTKGSATLFRTTYDPFTPAPPRNGTPIGNDPNDGLRLLGTLADARATAITNAIRRLARFAAVVTAHEIGHSVGLVRNGAMPFGLYGGDSTNFPGSSSGHIKMSPLIFPPGSVNVMSPAIGFEDTLSSGTGFNTLNLAYLRERALYNL